MNLSVFINVHNFCFVHDDYLRAFLPTAILEPIVYHYYYTVKKLTVNFEHSGILYRMIHNYFALIFKTCTTWRENITT